jgi:APA family basic amino acid/polyamine antiporter
MTGLVNYYKFKGDKTAATAFAVTGYSFLQTGLIVAILGYTSMFVMLSKDKCFLHYE